MFCRSGEKHLSETGPSVGRPLVGKEMFLNNPVAADDPCLPAVYENYWRNLAGICGIARGDGAEVVLSTVAVNLPTNARAKPARASANFQKSHGGQK